MAETLDDRMVGVLLAGGTGTRMAPLTDHTNKHLIPVHMRPMITYPLGTLLQIGLRQILVIAGRDHVGRMVEVLGSGSAFGPGVAFTFEVQEDALGIAHGIGLAEHFAAGRKLAVALGDNLFDDDGIGPRARAYAQEEGEDALAFLCEVERPEGYGVATLEGGRVARIVEKPEKPESPLAVTGLYLYPNDVFGRIRALRPSARGEYEISDVNDAYAREGRLAHHVVDRWVDCGEPEPWMRAQNHVWKHPERFGPERFRLWEPRT